MDYSKRLKEISDLEEFEFYIWSVKRELDQMKSDKVFAFYKRLDIKLLDSLLRRFAYVNEPVLQLVKSLSTGVVQVSKEVETIENSDRKLITYTLTLPEEESIIIKERWRPGMGYLKESESKWLTRQELYVIISSYNSLERNRGEIEGKKERKRIYDLLERANAPKSGS